jgi:hypothetical protein
LNHHATLDFWACYRSLPEDIQELADEAFARLKENPRRPSLRFKRVGKYWSARVGRHHRALAVEARDGFVWFWIGTHAEYVRSAASTLAA